MRGLVLAKECVNKIREDSTNLCLSEMLEYMENIQKILRDNAEQKQEIIDILEKNS